VKLPAFDEDVWELYDTNTDWSQSNDLAKKYPDKLKELQRLWIIEATKYNVLPLDDRFVERANAEIAGRPQLAKGNTQIFYGGMGRLTENSIINYKNKSHSVTADIEIPEEVAKGVVVAVGGSIGGWSLYFNKGKLKYYYNFLGVENYSAESEKTLPPGKHQVRMEFNYDGGGVAKGGNVTLFMDGKEIGKGRVGRTEPAIFSADETLDIGKESGSPVSHDYGPSENKFNGKVNWVQIDLDPDADHFIDSEERFRVAMALQ
jgi:arylsulfatase